MGKKLLISAAVLLLLGGILAVFWIAFDWPPPRLILKYGLPPAGGLTGRHETIGGIEFIEISGGFLHLSREVWLDRGTVAGRFLHRLGLPYGRQPIAGEGYELRWIEQSSPIWISRCWEDVQRSARWVSLRSESGRGFELLCRQLESKAGGSFRLARDEEVWFAAESGGLDLQQYEVIQILGSDGLFRSIWLGSEWGAFSGTTAEAKALLNSICDPRDVFLLCEDARKTRDAGGGTSMPFLVWIPRQPLAKPD